MKTILLVDTCSDLPLNYVEENSDVLDFIGMPVSINNEEYIDDFGKTFSHDKFYGLLREGYRASTAQINSYRFLEKFREHCTAGKAVIYIGFSSTLSGTLNSAMNAKDMLLEEMPNAKISVIDTLAASGGLGILAINMVELLRDGMNFEELTKWLEDNSMNTQHWFAVDDLDYLRKGGRVSATKAIVGTLLNVKPILTVSKPGALEPYTNVRGRKKSIKFLAEKVIEHAVNPEETIVFIGHGSCPEDAEKLREEVTKIANVKRIVMSELSATIASHVGPGMLGLTFVGKEREV